MKITENNSLASIEKSIIEEIKGKELWGDIAFSENEYEILRVKISAMLSQSGVTIGYICTSFPCALTTFLVFLMRYKYDTNFWGLVADELEIELNGAQEGEIGQCVRRIFTKYGFDYSEVKDERRINMEPILYEAGLPPESSLDDLFYVLSYDVHSIFDPQLIIEDLIGMRSYHIRKPMYRFLKRFQEDRALEFVLEVHDSMLSVNQSRAGESRYIGRYVDWKSKEQTKEYSNARKKQEFQTKPYLTFENGKRGLCMVLPRTVLPNEWIDDVEWVILCSDGTQINKRMVVFGDDGHRYVQSIELPICAAEEYTITLIDKESIEDEVLINWTIEGIKDGNVICFNANGRMIAPNYLMVPYGTLVFSKSVQILESKYITTFYQNYPTDRADYSIVTIQPDGRDAELVYGTDSGRKMLRIRPQIGLSFEGKRLFSIQDESYHLFTEIPNLLLKMDEGLELDGLNVRVGKESVEINDMFNGSNAVLEIKKIFKKQMKEYGTYSIRLYQYDHFLRQMEFSYVPNIKSNYSPFMKWPERVTRRESRVFKFERKADWELEFEGCIVNKDEEHYVVECPSDMCVLVGHLYSSDVDNTFRCTFELPVSPFSVELLDSNGLIIEDISDKVVKLGLNEIDSTEYWVGLECFGEYKGLNYQFQIRSSNGIEQKESIRLSQNGSANIHLSDFYDTLRSCPLPVQIELCCPEKDNSVLPLLVMSDALDLQTSPKYVEGKEKGFISIGIDDAEKNLTVKRFGTEYREYSLPFIQSKVSQSGVRRGYPLQGFLDEGLYTVEGNSKQSDFLFEDEETINITNGTNMLYISIREKDAPIVTFIDWLDQLIKDILSAGVNNDIRTGKAWTSISILQTLKVEELRNVDYEKLIAIAHFIKAKCVNVKKESMKECMYQISQYILDGKKRLELIRVLADMKCDNDIFDLCLEGYNLLLFEAGSADAKKLASKLETHSAELAMLLLMGVDAPIKETIWKEKYRELIGKAAIKTLLSVPNENDLETVANEQKLFIREITPCRVKINLTSEISGDMTPIQQMIEITHKYVRFNKEKKPDFGVYFDHIKYVDQYVNWYSLSHNKDGEMLPWKRTMMINVVKNNCVEIVKMLNDLKFDKELKNILVRYEEALRARTTSDILMNLNANDYSRYFYLQGMAAFMAVLPEEYRKYGWAIRMGEKFMSNAIKIAPRIARRDLIMARTFIYLMRKEAKLCR